MVVARTLCRLSFTSSRVPLTSGLTSTATSALLSRYGLRNTSSRTNLSAIASPGGMRAFSVSCTRFSEGSTDVLLSQKLAEELKYEREASEKAEPQFLATFRQGGIWNIEDGEGNDEVNLTRKFGNEHIRVIFSAADIQTAEEPGFGEEEEGESDEPENLHSYPIRVSFSITKDNANGSINVDSMCQGGRFMVDNISYYPDAKLGTELTAEADWKRRGLYIGPQFETLDVAVQEEFERFMQERGINESLALFIPEYAELKEQKEYVRWLDNLKKFIDA